MTITEVLPSPVQARLFSGQSPRSQWADIEHMELLSRWPAHSMERSPARLSRFPHSSIVVLRGPDPIPIPFPGRGDRAYFK